MQKTKFMRIFVYHFFEALLSEHAWFFIASGRVGRRDLYFFNSNIFTKRGSDSSVFILWLYLSSSSPLETVALL